MAVNIEMEYYDGNSYQVLRPRGNFSNMDGSLTSSQIPNLSASKITSGIFGTSRIPNLDASKINSGTFGTGRIPYLDASKINSGAFTTDRIPDLDASKITSGTISAARLPDVGAIKSEIVNYIGSGGVQVSIALTYERPYFIVGGGSDNSQAENVYSGFGFFGSSGITDLMLFSLVDVDYGSSYFSIMTYRAIVNSKQLTLQTNNRFTRMWAFYLLEKELSLLQSNQTLGKFYTNVKTQDYFNNNGDNYNYLIIY